MAPKTLAVALGICSLSMLVACGSNQAANQGSANDDSSSGGSSSQTDQIDRSCDTGLGWLFGTCTESHDVQVDNKTSSDLSLTFDAYYDSYCKSGHFSATAPASTQTTIHVVFTGCNNGGGESIDGMGYQSSSGETGYLTYPASVVTCDATSCTGTLTPTATQQ